MSRHTIKALCVGYIGSGIGLTLSYAVAMPTISGVIVILIFGAAPTLYMLNR